MSIIVRAVFGVTEQARMERMRVALKEFIEWGTSPRQIAYLSLMDIDQIERNVFFKRARRKVDAAVYDEIRHAPGARTWMSARTSCRCCSRPATRTARR